MITSVSALASRAVPTDGPRPIRFATPPVEQGPGRADRLSFSDTLRDAVGAVDEAQKAADGQVEAFVAGETDNVHDVMIALNQAELHFQLLTEVRNRLLEGYQEIMRMQV